jgi:nucleotide-binding universal stress UspA family protein
MFSNILVPVIGRESGWHAVEQALTVAQRENGRLYGLHILSPDMDNESQDVKNLQDEFDQRCQVSNVPGSLILATGEVAQNIIERARWHDLVIISLDYPPPIQPLKTLHHGFRNLVQRCPRPILAVTKAAKPLSRAMLAYDGSPKAREALFIAAYLSGRWNIPMVVINVGESGRGNVGGLDGARQYIEGYGLQAEYIQRSGSNDQAILSAVREFGCDLLLMGGYGHGPFLDIVLGSTVNRVLNEIEIPVLICR